MQIQGSTVLITGATGGIGQAIAVALGARGASLMLTGRRGDVLDPLAERLGARAIVADISVREQLEELVLDAGAPDILVANAALPASGRLEGYSAEQIDRALDVNLRAPIMLAHALIPAMLQRGRGHLLFMSSIAGKTGAPGSALYSAAKYGLRGFAACLRADLHGSGVGVSAVFPGFIRDAGMFADADVQLPAGVGTRSPQDVADAVIGAIEHNRGEVDVAPLSLRAGAIFAGLAPDLAASMSRRIGSEEIARGMERGQRVKR